MLTRTDDKSRIVLAFLLVVFIGESVMMVIERDS